MNIDRFNELKSQAESTVDEGDFRERYRVQTETTKGEWSKLWEYTFPGFIQRGYQRAGLAPDIPESD